MIASTETKTGRGETPKRKLLRLQSQEELPGGFCLALAVKYSFRR